MRLLNRHLPWPLIVFTLAIWGIYLGGIALEKTPYLQYHLGIHPRSVDNWLGIFTSSLVHANWQHIASNTVPLLILGGLIWIAYGQGVLFVVMLLGSAGSGACTWLTSSGDLVIGASGMVYAFVGFLLGVAYYRPSIKSWLVATLSLALYSGAILALFEVTEGISWAGHFYGFVAGIFTAMLLFARQKRKTQKEN